MTEPNPPGTPRIWMGFTKRALIVHGVLAVVTLGFWLLVPAAIYTWRRGGAARKVSYGLWSVVGLIAILLAYGLSVDSGNEAPATTQAAATTEPEAAPTTAAATTESEEPPVTTVVEPVDSGRMSESEYGQFSGMVSDVDAELSDYGDGLAKCSVLLQALELSEASDCIGESYQGVGDQMLAAYGTAESLEGDVAKGCLKALRLYRQRLDVFFGWHERTQDAGENLQFDEFGRLVSLSTEMTKRYRQGRDWVLRDCEPR